MSTLVTAPGGEEDRSGGSEVARLRQLIQAECDVMNLVFHGHMEGAAKHSFIDQRVKNLDRYAEDLAPYVGGIENALMINFTTYTETIGKPLAQS